MDKKYHVPNLAKALKILDILGNNPDGLPLTDIIKLSGVPKTTAFRIVTTFKDYGYLGVDNAGRYTFTHKLLAQGQSGLVGQSFLPIALTVMRGLRDITQETVFIGTLVETEGVILEQLQGLHMFRFSADPGFRFAIHVSAPGKAMVAYLPETERDNLIGKLKLEKHTANSITTKKALLEECEKIRKNGFSFDRNEWSSGVRCIGAPILNHHGYPVAAIWISGPTERLPDATLDEFAPLVRDHARDISHKIGFSCQLG